MAARTISRQWPYAAALAALAIAAGLGLHSELISLKDLLASALSLFGTFLGATFAFRLNQEKEAAKLEAERREALNRASFTLIRQWNAMDQLVKQFQAYSPPFARAFNMPALKLPKYEVLSHSVKELDFLLDSSNPGLLMELVIEEERFHQALQALQIRNDLYVTEVQPSLEKHGLNGKAVSLEQMRTLLGERVFESAVNGANNAWDLISSASESIPKVHRALLAQGKVLFPGKKLITYEKAA